MASAGSASIATGWPERRHREWCPDSRDGTDRALLASRRAGSLLIKNHDLDQMLSELMRASGGQTYTQFLRDLAIWPNPKRMHSHRFVTEGVARLEGFEPPTNGFGSHYSIRLSYRRTGPAF